MAHSGSGAGYLNAYRDNGVGREVSHSRSAISRPIPFVQQGLKPGELKDLRTLRAERGPQWDPLKSKNKKGLIGSVDAFANTFGRSAPNATQHSPRREAQPPFSDKLIDLFNQTGKPLPQRKCKDHAFLAYSSPHPPRQPEGIAPLPAAHLFRHRSKDLQCRRDLATFKPTTGTYANFSIGVKEARACGNFVVQPQEAHNSFHGVVHSGNAGRDDTKSLVTTIWPGRDQDAGDHPLTPTPVLVVKDPPVNRRQDRGEAPAHNQKSSPLKHKGRESVNRHKKANARRQERHDLETRARRLEDGLHGKASLPRPRRGSDHEKERSSWKDHEHDSSPRRAGEEKSSRHRSASRASKGSPKHNSASNSQKDSVPARSTPSGSPSSHTSISAIQRQRPAASEALERQSVCAVCRRSSAIRADTHLCDGCAKKWIRRFPSLTETEIRAHVNPDLSPIPTAHPHSKPPGTNHRPHRSGPGSVKTAGAGPPTARANDFLTHDNPYHSELDLGDRALSSLLPATSSGNDEERARRQRMSIVSSIYTDITHRESGEEQEKTLLPPMPLLPTWYAQKPQRERGRHDTLASIYSAYARGGEQTVGRG